MAEQPDESLGQLTKAPKLTPRRPTIAQNRRRRKAQDAFLNAYTKIGSIRAASEAVGVSWQSHYDWLDHEPDYAERWEAAQEGLTETLEKAAVERATVGSERGVYFQGEKVGTERWYSDSLLMFLLKSRRQVYRDSTAITGPDGGPIQVQAVRQEGLSRLTEAQLDALAALNGLSAEALRQRLLAPAEAPGEVVEAEVAGVPEDDAGE